MRVGTIKRWLVGLWPFCRYVWYRLPPSAGNSVALTFDDGPHPEYTPKVLDVLQEANAKGVFFLLGNACRKYPELVRKIVAEGHVVGIHGMDHSSRDLPQQADECRNILKELGVETNLFRPPRGQLPASAFFAFVRRGYRIVIWSVDAQDSLRYEGKSQSEKPHYDNLQRGDVVLLHDDNPVCLKELPKIISNLHEGGLQCASFGGVFTIDAHQSGG